MQKPAPISRTDFEEVLHTSFPAEDEDRGTDWDGVIDRMFEDFVLIDLRAAPALEFEALEPGFRDPEAAGTPFAEIHEARCAGGATHYAFARIGSEEELPVLAVLYWTGDRLAIAVPEEGNLLNNLYRAAFGRNETDEKALTTLLPNHGIPVAHGADYAAMVEDLAARGPWAGFDEGQAIAWTRDAFERA